MKSLVALLPWALLSNAYNAIDARSAATSACSTISTSLSGQSAVYYATSLSPNYLTDIEHWMVSSTQAPACVVEVGSDDDTATVMKIIASTRSPFAIKSGGHASNLGFSSTPGVFISLARRTGVALSPDKSTVTVGLGNTWTDVYKALDGTGRNVVGGRVTGPGTGGFTLGGGYSWLTNQYGLTSDTVKSYTLVLPNGTISEISSAQPDLFFALKGGLNRFGIVTQIVYNAVPQVPLVYGGYTFYAGASTVQSLINATQTFYDTNTDPKAQTILTINSVLGTPGAILLQFYDGPTEPASLTPYNNIPAVLKNVSSQSFANFAQSAPTEADAGSRGAFSSISTTKLTRPFLEAVANESSFWGQKTLLTGGTLITFDVEPFGNYGGHATDSAYPHSGGQLPLNLYWAWKGPENDAINRGYMKQSTDYLLQIAKAEGIFDSTCYTYPNYALADTPVDTMYGTANLARLRAIRAQVDPNNVMGLAGGFNLS